MNIFFSVFILFVFSFSFLFFSFYKFEIHVNCITQTNRIGKKIILKVQKNEKGGETSKKKGEERNIVSAWGKERYEKMKKANQNSLGIYYIAVINAAVLSSLWNL